jgi:ABC-type lipoprotein release transport system permease subunit
MSSLLNVRIGAFLALRQIKRSSKWTTTLIIFVMILTFLNLVVVSGVLVGLIQGSVDAQRRQYTSDVIISTLSTKTYIEHSADIISLLRSLPEVDAISPRYVSGVQLEANYKTRINQNDKANTAGGELVGIDPRSEDEITNLSKFVIEGSYLLPTDYDQILLGSFLVKKYVPVNNPGFSALENVEPGSKIRIKVNGIVREVTVKGILKSKVNETGLRSFMVDSQLRSLIGRNDFIEVDGIHHLTDPEQIIRDFKRDHFSDGDDFDTIHIPNELLKTHLEQIADAITTVVHKRLMK